MVLLLSLLLQAFTFVELNCENLFDTQHDTLKHDTEFLPTGNYHWTRTRYWRKLDHLGQELVAMGSGSDCFYHFPDLVALCEVENDTVMRDLTERSLLRSIHYKYVMTSSPDERGIDVALMYNPISFQLINHRSIRIPHLDGFPPTRDILYASGSLFPSADTLHIFVCHAPSRRGGESHSRPYRMLVAQHLLGAVDSVRALQPNAYIIIAGDFNDYSSSPALQRLAAHNLIEASKDATGRHGARATYRYHGDWRSLDHIFVSPSLSPLVSECFVGDEPFLMEEDKKYGGTKPRRTYLGPRYQRGYSDHLPLVMRIDYYESRLNTINKASIPSIKRQYHQ